MQRRFDIVRCEKKKVKFVSFVSFVVPFFKFYISTGHPNTLWGSVFEPPNISWGSPFRIQKKTPILTRYLEDLGVYLGGGNSNIFLCSIRTLGKSSSNLMGAYVSNWVGEKTHQPTSMEFLGMVTSGGKFGLTGDLFGSNPPRSSPRRNGEGKEIPKIRTEDDSVRGSSPWHCRSHELEKSPPRVVSGIFFQLQGIFHMFLFGEDVFVWTNLISSKLLWWHWCCLLKVRTGSIFLMGKWDHIVET